MDEILRNLKLKRALDREKTTYKTEKEGMPFQKGTFSNITSSKGIQ